MNNFENAKGGKIMEWLVLSFFIAVAAVVIAYGGEIYLYLSLVLSLIRDMQKKIKSVIGKK